MNMQVYNSVPDDKKKYMLGTAIYQILLRTYPEKLTSKLTGMVLEMQIPDLEAMIKDLNKLKACINAAKEVLRKHFTEVGDPDSLLEYLNLSM
mmetsp:Transcript_37136/g.6622  ORF Transcript_37136/g.6622 Transcript_37136/m.6622 type:complete len:93 (+) Transcript_37136:1429-1707(+)